METNSPRTGDGAGAFHAAKSPSAAAQRIGRSNRLTIQTNQLFVGRFPAKRGANSPMRNRMLAMPHFILLNGVGQIVTRPEEQRSGRTPTPLLAIFRSDLLGEVTLPCPTFSTRNQFAG